jgi:hypothetical protein
MPLQAHSKKTEHTHITNRSSPTTRPTHMEDGPEQRAWGGIGYGTSPIPTHFIFYPAVPSRHTK